MARSSEQKLKSLCFSIEDKLDVCDISSKKVPIGPRLWRIIGKSTVGDIIKQEEKLNSFKQSPAERCILKSVKTTKSINSGMCEMLDKPLLSMVWAAARKWFSSAGPILLAKASDFDEHIYPESAREFKSSLGFQYRFCRCFGIKSLAIA